ncbi:hypothetical protein M8C13_44135 [Crossiella sp. SN42]|uniref:hypothetical protein n=1 Tax=Crossiella sp. SN42 TaxID=2944808 RepID=UPI00207C3DE7|nr:hypothetical protein [Crossiella sp. SN42]MCO1582758.1 hypothetical protein [Crossiella sp. SN42]
MRGERLLVLSALTMVALLVTGLLALIAAPHLRPQLSYAEGAVPAEEATYTCRAAMGLDGVLPCPRERDYRWRLAAHGSLSTTWTTSRSDTDHLGGVLVRDRAECPDSEIGWTLSANGRASSGVLSGTDRAVVVNLDLAESQDRITLALRRLDAAPCASSLEWRQAAPEAPWLGFLWSW